MGVFFIVIGCFALVGTTVFIVAGEWPYGESSGDEDLKGRHFYPAAHTTFSSVDDILDPEVADDARCLLDSYGDREVSWEFVYMDPAKVCERVYKISRSREWYATFSGQELIGSIRKVGFDHAIVLLGGLCEGNHRLAAAMALDLPRIPVYVGHGKNRATRVTAYADPNDVVYRILHNSTYYEQRRREMTAGISLHVFPFPLEA